MVVQHNLTAMNSNRMLGLTTASQAKSTEKLSSGYKINRAADDAAGLSISEKMRKQIRGLTQASLNAQDGISAVQTAEGALTEVHDMLQRMNELAVKSANGTNSEDDRGYIQDEIDQLVKEIDRVSETTKFNETYLLKGTKTDEDVTSLDSVFNGCSKLKKIIGIDKWDTSRVQSFSAMFADCTLLEDFSFFKNWDMSSLTNANYMFAKCTSLKYPPLTTFGNPKKPTTTVGHSQMYEQTTFPVDNSIQWKVVGACSMYRVFVQNNYVSQFNIVWETDEVVNVPGLFCDSRSRPTSLKTFNLTSCGQSIFTASFFGNLFSQVNANLTNFECCGTQKYNLNLSLYPNLSKQSLLNVINCLCTTTNTLTLTLGSTNMAKLTDEEIAIATAKGWTVA